MSDDAIATTFDAVMTSEATLEVLRSCAVTLHDGGGNPYKAHLRKGSVFTIRGAGCDVSHRQIGEDVLGQLSIKPLARQESTKAKPRAKTTAKKTRTKK